MRLSPAPRCFVHLFTPCFATLLITRPLTLLLRLPARLAALKLLTLPLNKQQIESTAKMQAIQPAAKRLQEKYRNADPARLNLELQKLYQENQVNPLAGCLPSLAQIPIFIALYRSVLNLAKADRLEESFLWLPSLEGPVDDYTKGTSWLFGNAALGYEWHGLSPPLGWHDTLAYLVLPVLLVLSQYVSMSILTPKNDDPAQAQTQAILKFLPLMIGWFSLSVPSGLGLYWMTNNILTTLTTVLIKKGVATTAMAGGPDVSSAPADVPPPPQGFGRKFGEIVETTASDGTRVRISPPGSKRAARRQAAAADATATVLDADVTSMDDEADEVPDAPDMGMGASAAKPRPTKKKGGKKKEKPSW
jgi:YidC/Oxa1 family membrane protein insertase